MGLQGFLPQSLLRDSEIYLTVEHHGLKDLLADFLDRFGTHFLPVVFLPFGWPCCVMS